MPAPPILPHMPEVVVAPKIWSWRDLVDQVAEAGEMILYGLLYHEAEVIQLEGNIITLAKTPSWNDATLRKAMEGLSKATGSPWRIEIQEGEGAPSLSAADKALRAQKLERARAHGVVETLLHAFPGAEVIDVIGEDNV